MIVQLLNNNNNNNNNGEEEKKKKSYNFIARRDIKTNEQVNFDYETTEYDFYLNCSCGSTNCRKTLKGYRYNKQFVLDTYGSSNNNDDDDDNADDGAGGIAPYLLKL